MRKFRSLDWAPSDTRQLLRRRLRRFLPQHGPIFARPDYEVTLSDESMLLLLQSIGLAHASEEAEARRHHAALAAQHGCAATFDDLLADRWFGIFMGRIEALRHVSVAAGRSGTDEALAGLMRDRFKVQVDSGSVPASDPKASAVAARVAAQELRFGDVGCPSPQWVAARLWERRPAAASPLADIRWWLDRWEILGKPNLVPSQVWDDRTGLEFLAVALQTLAEAELCEWARIEGVLAIDAARASGAAVPFVDHIPPLPATLPGRYHWLHHPVVEPLIEQRIDAYDAADGLVSLLLNEVDAAPHSQAPHPLARQLLDLTILRPDLFAMVERNLPVRPALIAELLLHPPTCAAGCAMIVDMPVMPSGSDRELEARDDLMLKDMAFEDAVAVVTHFASEDRVPAEDLADLLALLYRYRKSKRQPEPYARAARVLLEALTSEADAIGEAIAAALLRSADLGGPDSPRFLAALDLIEAVEPAVPEGAEKLAENYVDAIRQGESGLAVDQISPAAASTLLRLAKAGPQPLFDEMLRPPDVAGRMSGLDGDKRFEERIRLRRSIRATVLLLSRAIAVEGSEVTEPLIEALAAALKAGAAENPAGGQTAAFPPEQVPTLWTQPPSRPLGAEIAAAFSAVGPTQQDKLLEAVLVVEEPMLLAEILAGAPREAQERIAARLGELDPDSAPELWSLYGVQQRIEALLNAGLEGPAEKFLENEKNLKTVGNVPERAQARLRHTLRLHLLRQEWQQIADSTVPDGLPEIHRRAAEDSLSFYKGLAALQRPDGKRAEAVHRFQILADRHPSVPAYALNLFAAQVQQELGDDTYSLIPRDRRPGAARLLAEAERRLREVTSLTSHDREIHATNAAILLLALERPREAAERLEATPSDTANPGRTAFLAVALARMGRQRDALLHIGAWEDRFGQSEALKAARAHILYGHGYQGPAPFALDDDVVQRLKHAILELRQLDPVQQTSILSSARNGFTDFILRQVRLAATSVVNLVPMMDVIALKGGEDNLSALLRELFHARFSILNWAAPDQSRGGHNPAGNPQERDLILLRDSTVLAGFEAVVAEGGIPRAVLREHFQKLLGYAGCRLYFHLTYASNVDSARLLSTLREIAEKDAPAGYSFLDRHNLPRSGNEPDGFLARYGVGEDEVEVVFLILDFEQAPLRAASKAAARQSPPGTKS